MRPAVRREHKVNDFYQVGQLLQGRLLSKFLRFLDELQRREGAGLFLGCGAHTQGGLPAARSKFGYAIANEFFLKHAKSVASLDDILGGTEPPPTQGQPSVVELCGLARSLTRSRSAKGQVPQGRGTE